MSLFNDISGEVRKGIDGENAGVPIGFHKLNSYIGIRKRIYTLIFGSSGTGKSSLAHNAYILNPYDWYISPENKTKIKLKIVYFSMERSSVYVASKWIVRKIFLDHGVTIPLSTLLGWKKEKLTKDQHDLFEMYEDYIDGMESVVEIIDGGQNPTGIYKWMKEYAALNGKLEKISEFKRVYIPNNEHLITLIIVDHQSLLKKEEGVHNKKEAIDKTSAYLQQARDLYGFSPVMVAQMNRDIANPVYQKGISFEPVPEQIKDSSTPYEDSDVCMSLFDPIKFKTGAPTGHDLTKLIDGNGAKWYRSVKIHKNTWGEDDVRMPLAFHGALGLFTEMKQADKMTDDDYRSVLNASVFLPYK